MWGDDAPQELCQEFHRCEGILEAQAPELFKKYDYNSNGQLEYRELRDILRQLQLEFREAFMEVRRDTTLLVCSRNGYAFKYRIRFSPASPMSGRSEACGLRFDDDVPGAVDAASWNRFCE